MFNDSLYALHKLVEIFHTATPKTSINPFLSLTELLPLLHSISLRNTAPKPVSPPVAPRVLNVTPLSPVPDIIPVLLTHLSITPSPAIPPPKMGAQPTQRVLHPSNLVSHAKVVPSMELIPKPEYSTPPTILTTINNTISTTGTPIVAPAKIIPTPVSHPNLCQFKRYPITIRPTRYTYSTRSRYSQVTNFRALTKPPTQRSKFNGALYVERHLLCRIMASAAEIGGVSHNCQISAPLRIMLQKIRHPQPPSLVQIDNSTVVGFINSTIKIKRI